MVAKSARYCTARAGLDMLQHQRGEDEIEPLLTECRPIVVQPIDLYRRQISAARHHGGNVESHDSPRDGGEIRKIATDPAPEIEHAIERGG